ncbi:MAG: electron transport complex subunit RsxG [Xanthomonadales bacterium]|nr:electron transport complex subunit RsxG [Gammaproteobacteria bacterium]NNK52121.1 electron transport complex subunit RsxG [Xanthomonadales bacterium]
MLRSAAALGLVAIIGTSLLTGVHFVTAGRIAEQEKRVILQQLGQLVPDRYDNQLLDDRFTFTNERYFPNGQPVTAWRARQGAQPAALILKFNATRGYNGDITLLAGINASGSLRGVRVISHKETPGLGDAIELEKSDWILGFTGRSLKNPSSEKWAVRREGGEFDQFTGATITPKAVIDAVRMALEYFETNREFLFNAPADDGGNLKS